MIRTAPPNEPAPPTGRALAALRRGLLRHYDRTRRALPWRGERDPYRVWVSEVMLQQTRVDTVLPYYRRWMERFPDLEALAAADADEVMLAWEGLGYYRRARRLLEASRLVRDRFGGRLPGTARELRGLPGIGEYTAGAIASIAHGEAVAAVDGNVRRVLARLFDVAEPGAAWLRRTAAALVDPDRPGDWNQALMDLGATVCTPRAPACAGCPLADRCAARAAGTQEARPRPRRARSVQERSVAVAVVVDGRGRGLMERRPDNGLLGGLWAFPEVPLEEHGGPVEGARAAALAAGAALAPDGEAETLSPVRHRFTHLTATYHPVLLRGGGGGGPGRAWVDLRRPERVALPVAQRKIAGAAAAAWAESEQRKGRACASAS